MIRGETLEAVCVEARKDSQGTTGPTQDESCEDQRGKCRESKGG